MATTEDRQGADATDEWRRALYEQNPEREGLFTTISGLDNEPLYTPENVEIDYDRTKGSIGVHTSDEYKANAIWEVLQQRLVSRNVPLKNVQRGAIEQAGGSTVRQEITLVQSIDTDLGKKIVRFIKDQKFKKANASLQGDSIRVSSPSREELQAVIKSVKGEDWGIELKFGNYR